MKLAIYTRVSTTDQHPENQKLALEDYANRQGYDYDVFQEKESSRNTRPIKQEVLRLLRSRVYDGVLIWKLDRWGRSTSELVLELNEFSDKGILFISLQDNIDLSTPIGRMTAYIFSAFAEFEREQIRERTLIGLERAKKEGKKLGRPPGSKDKKVRKKSGYYQRWAGKKTSPVKSE